jgi:hypothetical protein
VTIETKDRLWDAAAMTFIVVAMIGSVTLFVFTGI